MGRPVVHFEIGGKNAKKLQSFYAKQFGWKINANNPMKYGVVETGAPPKRKGINGGVFEPPPGAPSQVVTVYIEVPNIAPVLASIEKAGGKTVMPRTPIPGMVTMAQFTDPAGNVIGLVESKIPPAPKPVALAKKVSKNKPQPKKKAKKSGAAAKKRPRRRAA